MKLTIISIIIAAAFIGGAVFLSKGGNSNEPINNVSLVEGRQIIDITAKGRYNPKVTQAKADIPTIIKVGTNGTYDCTSALRIPSLNYSANLPASGITEIEVPPQKAGTSMKGVCSMGMYSFAINFN